MKNREVRRKVSKKSEKNQSEKKSKNQKKLKSQKKIKKSEKISYTSVHRARSKPRHVISNVYVDIIFLRTVEPVFHMGWGDLQYHGCFSAEIYPIYVRRIYTYQ